MTTVKHTPIATGAQLLAAVLNAPLSQLDAAILAVEAAIAGASLPVTTTDATANSGQPVVPVASTDGFVVGQSVWIGDLGGTFETRTILSIQAGVSLTMSANLTNTYAAGKVVSASPSELVEARAAFATVHARLQNIEADVDAVEAAVAALGSLPLGEIGYAEVTAMQGTITAEVDLTGLAVTVDVGTGRRIRITASVLIQSSVAADRIKVDIQEGATHLHQGPMTVGIANQREVLEFSVNVSPTPGSHTYKLTGSRADGTGTVSIGGIVGAPGSILVEDLGAA